MGHITLSRRGEGEWEEQQEEEEVYTGLAQVVVLFFFFFYLPSVTFVGDMRRRRAAVNTQRLLRGSVLCSVLFPPVVLLSLSPSSLDLAWPTH